MSILEAIGIATVIVGNGLATYALGSILGVVTMDVPASQRIMESRTAGAAFVMIVTTLLFLARVF